MQVGAADYHHTMAGIGGLQTQSLGQQKPGLSLGGLGELCCIAHSLPIVLWCRFISIECQISEYIHCKSTVFVMNSASISHEEYITHVAQGGCWHEDQHQPINIIQGIMRQA